MFVTVYMNVEGDAAFVSVVGMNPDQKPLGDGSQGLLKAAWATEWFTPQQIGVWNWERWNSPEFGRLHEEGLHERDPQKRDAIYRRMQDLMEQSGAYLFLTHGADAFVHRVDLEPAQWPDGKPVFAKFREATA